MRREPYKIIGFLIFWFGFAFTVGLVYFLFYMELGYYILRFVPLVAIGIVVMIHGFYTMTGSKFTISEEFWKEKFGVGYPIGFGGILRSYITIIGWLILCVVFIVFVAPTLVQRLFILLVGNTVLCLLLYFKFKDRRKLE